MRYTTFMLGQSVAAYFKVKSVEILNFGMTKVS